MSDDRLEEWLSPGSGYFVAAGRLLERRRTQYQDLEVWETAEYGRLLRLDGAFMTSERDEFFYHENLVHLPAVSHPNPTSALVIGGGDGGSAEELFKHPSMRRVVLAELDGEVVEAARKWLYPVHRGSLDDPRLELVIGDGLQYVATAGEQFDLIFLDLTDPGGPSAPLYTEAFYRQCRGRLKPGGAMSLHLGSPVAQPERFRETVATLRQVFPIVRPYLVYVPLYGSLWGMACVSDNLDPMRLDANDADSVISMRDLQDLQFYNGETHRGVLALPNFVRALTR